MRPRIVMLLAFIIAAVAVGFTGARFTLLPTPTPAVQGPLPDKRASYLGVFETNAPPSYGPIAEFANAVGRQPNLVGYYSGWAQAFPTSFADLVHRRGLTLFVQIDPEFASVSAIASGAYDTYLRTYADAVRDFHYRVVIGFGHEMNATWYSWGYTHTAPATFVAAWQHIVTVFREEGASNVTWLWTIQADENNKWPIAAWWPGANYVNWVGIDGYYLHPTDTFQTVFVPTIHQVQTLTDKPVLLSETAVTPHGNQYDNILNLFIGMRQYNTLGLVWFDEDQKGSIDRQDWRIEGNTVATSAFRYGVSNLSLVSNRP